MSVNLRTPETQAQYETYKASGGLAAECALCKAESLVTFRHWKVVKNDFPYDRIARIHDLLLPLRHSDGRDLTEAEQQELNTIKQEFVQSRYEYILEATHATKSIPGHFHLHIIVGKEEG